MFSVSRSNFIPKAAFLGFILFSLGSLLHARPAQSLALAWNPSSDPSVTGYSVLYGTTSGDFTNSINVGNSTSVTISNLTAGTTYYLVVTAYNSVGAESAPSNEISTIAQALQYGITSVDYLSNGTAQITVTGSIGLKESIYASNNLKTWALLATAINTTGTVVAIDPVAMAFSERFYRMVDATGTSDPAGFTKLTITGAASATSTNYSHLGMGFTNPVSTKGEVTSFGVQTITDSGAIWNDNQFNGGNGQFYIEIVSGSHAGLMSDIIATSASAQTLTTADDLSTYLVGGELFKIRKHRSIGDVFGVNNSAGLHGGASASTADEVQVFNPVTQTYLRFYYQTSGTGGIGWRSSTDPATDASGTTLYLDQGVVVCRKIAGSLSLVLTGAVKIGPTVVPIGANLNLVANMYPAGTLTLASSGLYNADPALGLVGASSVTDADEVEIYSGTTIEIYYYKTGGAGGTGWRNANNPAANYGGLSIPAGSSIYVLRKNGNAAFNWTVPQPF